MAGPRRLNPRLPSIYAGFLPAIVAFGREYGYAICVHGSMATDFDLLAVPWTDDARSADDLVAGFVERFRLIDDYQVQGPDQKPHGRRAWAILIGGEMVIDLSVMPRVG